MLGAANLFGHRHIDVGHAIDDMKLGGPNGADIVVGRNVNQLLFHGQNVLQRGRDFHSKTVVLGEEGIVFLLIENDVRISRIGIGFAKDFHDPIMSKAGVAKICKIEISECTKNTCLLNGRPAGRRGI